MFKVFTKQTAPTGSTPNTNNTVFNNNNVEGKNIAKPPSPKKKGEVHQLLEVFYKFKI